MPKLGSKAYIDTQNDVDKDKFVKHYAAQKKSQEKESVKKETSNED